MNPETEKSYEENEDDINNYYNENENENEIDEVNLISFKLSI